MFENCPRNSGLVLRLLDTHVFFPVPGQKLDDSDLVFEEKVNDFTLNIGFTLALLSLLL